jgi:hypothetical protein
MLLATETVRELAPGLLKFLNEPLRSARAFEAVFAHHVQRDLSPRHHVRAAVQEVGVPDRADWQLCEPQQRRTLSHYRQLRALVATVLRVPFDERVQLRTLAALRTRQALVGITGFFPHPDSGKLTLALTQPQFGSVEHLVGVLMAELDEEGHGVNILPCRSCDRFILQLRRRGHPVWDCKECAKRRTHKSRGINRRTHRA